MQIRLGSGNAMLEVELIGPPVVTVDGAPLNVDTRKAIALLAYLAASERRRRRDHLAGMLWPESSEERARAALRRTLAALRSGLGGRWVVADRDTVTLGGDGLSVDVDRLAVTADSMYEHGHGDDEVCDACIPILRQALRIVRGEFMEGFHLTGSFVFDDWVQGTSDRIRATSAMLMDRLADAETARGDFDAATVTLRRRLWLDPLHEPTYRRLMLLRAWTGDRAGSVEVYRECVGTLQDELGVTPVEETTELHEAILDEDLPRAPSRPRETKVIASVTPPAPPALVGRSSEWEQLRLAVERGAHVAVKGVAGIGRTRLLDELATSLAGEHRPVLIARARPSYRDVGFGLLQELLKQALRLVDGEDLPAWARSEIGRLVPDRFAPALGTDPTEGRRLADAAVRLLGAAHAVIIIDDAQWCDGASAQVLARAVDELRSSIVVAFRSDEVMTNNELVDVFEARKSRLIESIELRPLDQSSVKALTSGNEGIDPAELYRVTAGVPLFVVAFLDAGPDPAGDIPPQIKSLLLRRVDDLPTLSRQVLTAVAAIGRPASFDLIRDVSGRSETEVLDAVDTLLERRMLREGHDSGDVEIEHPLLADTVLESATQVRRKILHRRIAEALARSAASTELATTFEIAHHFSAADEQHRAADWFVRAGEAAREVYAHDEAEQAFRAALAAGHVDASRLHGEIGDLGVFDGRFGEALVEYETAARLSTGSRLALIEHRLGDLHRRLGRWEAAHYHFSLAEADHPKRTLLYADWSLLAWREGDTDRALEYAKSSLDEAVDPDERSRAHNVLGIVISDDADARTHLEEAAVAAGDEPHLRMAALNNLSDRLGRSGDLDGALALARDALVLAVEVGDRHRQAALHDRLAGLHKAAGEMQESQAESLEATEIFASLTGPDAWEPELWRLVQW
jgi:DNA-binding SARP family transcriptional activator/tetratricopeptide (TPR) repeat protein